MEGEEVRTFSFERNLVIGLIILFTGAFVVPRNGLASLEEGLVGYWSFDEGSGNIAHDYSGNNNHGTIYGATWVDGISGSALSFDGVSDYVDLGNPTTLNPETAITLAAWYKPVSYRGIGSDPILTKGYTTHTYPFYQYHLAVSGDRFPGGATFGVNVAAGGRSCSASTPPGFWSPGNWYHIVATYDGVAIRLYVNATLIDWNPAQGAIENYGRPIHFGKHTNLNYYLPGTIDEVRIYDRALRQVEIEYLYNNPGGQSVLVACEALTPIFCRGKRFYFKLTVQNKTGGNVSGTLVFRSYSGYDCDPGNLLDKMRRPKSFGPGLTQTYYYLRAPYDQYPPGPYSASVSGTLSGYRVSCCMNGDIIQCEPWRIGDNTEWELVEVERPEVALPTVTELYQNYPNPFNASTTIDYQLPAISHVKLDIYNLLGQKLVTLVDERQEAGSKSVIWDASEVSSGLYFYKLTAGDFTETRRMMLVK
jgi:hypothetical protein